MITSERPIISKAITDVKEPKSILNHNVKNENIVEFSINMISMLNSLELQSNNYSNIYFSVLFPNINQANNIPESAEYNEEWFRKIHDRLYRFLMINNDEYEKTNKHSVMNNSISNLFVNQSIEIVDVGLNPIPEENGAIEIIKKRDSEKSQGKPIEIKEIVKIQSKSAQTLNRYIYSERIRKNLKLSPKKSVKTRNTEIKENSFNFSDIKQKESRKKENKNIVFNLSIKNLIKDELKNKELQMKRGNLTKRHSMDYDINDTHLFLNELECLINMDSRASIELYSNSKKFKKKKVKITEPLPVCNLFSPHHEMNTSHNMFVPKLEEVEVVKTLNSTRIVRVMSISQRINNFERRNKNVYPESDSD
jgi:hypothetical protein